MRFAPFRAMALAVVVFSTNADNEPRRMGRRRLSAVTESSASAGRKYMSLPLDINVGDIEWGFGEDYDNENTDGDDEIDNIIGGDQLQRGDRPYLVSLGKENSKKYIHGCTATLIASQVVLSAAHCSTDEFGEFSSTNATIKINVYELNNNTDVINYPICAQEYGGPQCDRNTHAYAMRHPRYAKNKTVFLDNDFMLIFLPKDVTNIQPVLLNADRNFPSAGLEMEIFGWGDTNKTTELDMPNVPYIAKVMIMSSDLCTNVSRSGGILISENQLCTSNEGKATGVGDSGGPLIHIFPNGSSVQVGVTSYGISLESGMNDGPSVFARISAGLDWITSTVCGEIGEWCASNEDGSNCFDATRDTSYSDNIFSDFDVDMLPGFIEEKVKSGAHPLSNNHFQRAVLSSAVMTNLNKETDLFNEDFGVPHSTASEAKVTNSSLPFIVSIGLSYLENKTQVGHVCAGTLIQPDVVLSSAHCFSDRYGHKISLDWVDLPANAAVPRIQLKKSNIWRHIKYNHSTRANDLALVFLDTKVDVQPVRLNEGNDYPLLAGVSLNITGWGPKRIDGLYLDRQRTVDELYTPNSECNYPDITSDKMCTTTLADEVNDRCIGDSGSPVIVNTDQGPVQVGVTSLNACRARPSISTPCPSNMKVLTVTVLTDNFPGETYWNLISVCSGQLEASVVKRTKYGLKKTLYSDDYCVPDAQYDFTIFDEYGDGMCCGSGVGGYNVTLDGRLVASGGTFAASDTTVFGTPNGVCLPPLPNIHSRVSAGMEWINQAIRCRSGTTLIPSPSLKPTPTITLKPTPIKTLKPTITLEPTPTKTLKPTPTITLKPTLTITLKPTPTITLKPSTNHQNTTVLKLGTASRSKSDKVRNTSGKAKKIP